MAPPARPLTPAERLGARLSRLPGVTMAEAGRRAGVSQHALRRARETLGASAWPSREDLLLCALTDAGRSAGGPRPASRDLAVFIDWQNHDGTTAAEVEAMLLALVEGGRIELTDGQFRLLTPWP